ncbi:hypothetical protein [Rhizobium sp. LCM 4573]|uniref:hypothetical protein n=1 Tax=Rhizobium sp. LCM 4573 TaxID=1848291 RepID=UPI0008DAC40A|nr:hypothetical protein [Rhizobium sp. LCM 4573]OHV82609.1 hypothetical protein LCM4573_16555 [Rhizobium sp. LCM 4573]
MSLKLIALTTTIATIAAVAVTAPQAFALEPIQGSITYGGQQATRLTKAPIGSVVPHDFYSNGEHYRETYVIAPDRSLSLVSRVRSNN